MVQNMKGYLPLFASNILLNYIEEDTTELRDDTSYVIAEKSDVDKDQTPNNYRVLESYPRIRDIILNKFKIAANEFLGVGEQEFIVTTSWLTKTEPGTDSQFHSHKNSYYSGGYYYDTYTDDMGGIDFDSPIEHLKSYHLPPEQIHMTNAMTWSLPVQENILLFFPSYLKHKVAMNKSDKNRRSLAFNIVPVGFYGDADSAFDTDWIPR